MKITAVQTIAAIKEVTTITEGVILDPVIVGVFDLEGSEVSMPVMITGTTVSEGIFNVNGTEADSVVCGDESLTSGVLGGFWEVSGLESVESEHRSSVSRKSRGAGLFPG
jgi:hypothetical protein